MINAKSILILALLMGFQRFCSGYYVVNSLLIAVWYFLRPYVDQEELNHRDIFGVDMEVQLYFCLGAILFLKYLNSATIELFLSTLFAYTKVVILIILAVTQWKLAVWYLLAVILIFVLFPQPTYKGPNKVEHWISAEFAKYAELFDLTSQERKKANQKAFVMFYTQWASNCAALSPILAQLSMRYASPTFKFAKLDIGRAHQIAARYNISTATNSKQLPTFILFENGKETSRLPEINGSSVIPTNFTLKEMESHFNFQTPDKPQTRTNKPKSE